MWWGKADWMWLRFYVLSQISWIIDVVKHHSLGERKDIYEAFIRPNATAKCTILNLTPIDSKSHLTSTVVRHNFATICSSQSLSTNGSLPQTGNEAPLGGLFSSQQCPDDNLGSMDNSSWTATSKCSPLRKHANQFHQPHGYGYPPW